MRQRDVASLAVSLALVFSCTDAPHGTNAVLAPGSRSAGVELNTVEGLIDALFPNGQETAALQRWTATQDAIARGDTKIARQHLMQLADFVLKKQAQDQLDDPDGGDPMTVNDGVVRLISLMFGAVFPGDPAPPANLSGDFVLAVVDGSHQTVVTPSDFAGVEFPAGAAPEPFLLLVRQSDFQQDGRCTGPLRTRLCQFPRFYEFHPFPYTVLNRGASFGVCHVTDDPSAPNSTEHPRVRLAHDAPPDAPRKGYQTVDGAEILPLVHINFLECHPHVDIIDRIGAIMSKVLLPPKAYAIDMGGGGESDMFSNFNVVDPGPPPESPPVIVIDPGKGKPPRDR